MNEFDHFMKQRLRIKRYVRYADDSVILSELKVDLETLLPEVSRFLYMWLNLDLHPNKVSIETFASGVDLLGWVHFPNHSILRTATKRRMFAKIRTTTSANTLQSYLGMVKHGSTMN